MRDKFERGAISLGFHCDREDGKYVDQWLQSGWELFVAGNDKSEIDALKTENDNVRRACESFRSELDKVLVERNRLASENERFKAGLQFYANHEHLMGNFPSEWPDWDTCSGEPGNWWFNSEEPQEQPVGVEDGTVASAVLRGAIMTPDSDETICVPPKL